MSFIRRWTRTSFTIFFSMMIWTVMFLFLMFTTFWCWWTTNKNVSLEWKIHFFHRTEIDFDKMFSFSSLANEISIESLIYFLYYSVDVVDVDDDDVGYYSFVSIQLVLLLLIFFHSLLLLSLCSNPVTFQQDLREVEQLQ